MASLWHHINCPRSAVLHAHLIDWRDEGWRPFVNTFVPHLTGRSECRVLEIMLSPLDDDVYQLALSTFYAVTDEEPISHIALKIKKADILVARLMISAFTSHLAQAFDALRVHLELDDQSEHASLWESFGGFSSITHVKSFQLGTLNNLLAIPATSHGLATAVPRFPSLDTITVACNLRGAHTLEAVQERCETLLATLRSRHDSGHPILTIYLVEGPASCTAKCPVSLRGSINLFSGLVHAIDKRIQLYSRFNAER
ncbi:unnamed protein product [Peniophora sp. CBMAI 1063]|nr:unnamed protein product [Peniophora sp. CBMAI 1063]